MGYVEGSAQELDKREAKVKAMGGAEQVQKQHNAKKMTARERLDLLFDKGSFCEIGMLVQHRSADFDMPKTYIAGDGVITGHGTVNGRPIFAYAQDFTSMGGTVGEAHARKIAKVIDMAMCDKVPLVGLCDSGGARIQEGIDALTGYAAILFRNSIASGVIPQITAVMGPTAGGAVYSPALTDWVFMVENTSCMFVTGPDVVKAVMGEDVDQQGLGGAMVHGKKTGVAHFVCSDDKQTIEMIKQLLGYLPLSYTDKNPPVVENDDDPHRTAPLLDKILPDNPQRAYDMKEIIQAIVDNGEFLETHRYFARNIITCFARMEGRTVGIIANQPLHMAGCLDVDASDKATRFIRFCDCFNIPIITFVDVPGYLPGTNQEHSGIIRHGAKLLWAYAEATVPKISMVIHKNYGGSYLALASREMGIDYVLAWPTAEIAVMGAEGAAAIIHRREINADSNPEAKRQEKIEEYRKHFSNPFIAASRGLVDDIIQPRFSRARIIDVLRILRNKDEVRPAKKHGNIPV